MRVFLTAVGFLLLTSHLDPHLGALALEGDYNCTGTNPDGSGYRGTTTITPISHNRYSLKWEIGTQTYTGTGALAGNTLTVDWDDTWPVIYKVKVNGTLEGTWSNGRATETLVPRMRANNQTQRQAQQQQERNRQARERQRRAEQEKQKERDRLARERQRQSQQQGRQSTQRGVQGQVNNSRCIAGRMIRHILVDGHVANGHEITRIAPAPSVAGLSRELMTRHGQKNSNNQFHGLTIHHLLSGSVNVQYYDNGTLLEVCEYDSSGRRSGVFLTHTNGKPDGVQYQFLSGGGWSFETYRAGVKHGPAGIYDSSGQPSGVFLTHANGKLHGVRYHIFKRGSFIFETYRAGVRHGPYGGYNVRGQRQGPFGSNTNGNADPGEIFYINGVRQ